MVLGKMHGIFQPCMLFPGVRRLGVACVVEGVGTCGIAWVRQSGDGGQVRQSCMDGVVRMLLHISLGIVWKRWPPSSHYRRISG